MIKITKKFIGNNKNVLDDVYKAEIEQIAGLKWDEIDKKFSVILDKSTEALTMYLDGVSYIQNPISGMALELGECDNIAIPIGTTAWIIIEF